MAKRPGRSASAGNPTGERPAADAKAPPDERPRHDAAYKLLFAHPRAVADLLRLPDIRRIQGGGPDPAALTRVSDAFVGDALRRRTADMVWRAETADGGVRHVLIEFQATVDANMHLRVAEYATLLRRSAPAEDRGPGGSAPSVLAVVVYNGEDRWTAPADTEGVFGLESPGGRSPPWYALAALREAPEEEALPAGNVVGWMARLERAGTNGELLALWKRLRGMLEREGERGLRDAFWAWIVYVLVDPAADTARELQPRVGEADMTTLVRRAEQMRERERREWFVEGRAEGRALGRTEGAVRARTRMAALKFGADTAAGLAERLEAIVDLDVLDRVGDAIIQCENGDELLARVDALTGR